MKTAAFPIEDSSHVSAARRGTLSLAARAGFDETRAGQAAIVVTELSTNILKHATRGEILVTECFAGGEGGIEILALDSGAGLGRVDLKITDGHSTSGSLGQGLGAVSRLSDSFDVFSAPNKGSVVMTRLWEKRKEHRGADLVVAGMSTAVAGEEISGDDWTADVGRHRASVVVVDGLGHGLLAADASSAALREFARDPQRSPAVMLEDVHHALRPTRGAAVGIARLDLDQDLLLFAGLGNISGTIVAGTTRRALVSHNGIAGHAARHFQEFSYPLPKDAVLVLHSDGIGSQWNPADYAGLWVRDPSLIAGVLYRDFTRRRDDATVVVAMRSRRSFG
jgi:anti-sigma regulatory factor (Ser/Thr protein kinase)